MTWEDSWLVKNRCHPTVDGVRNGRGGRARDRGRGVAARAIGEAAVA